jgi:endothelin-converting enzyme
MNIRIIVGALAVTVGAMFVRSAFHGESKPSAQSMIDSIKQAFEKRLTKLTW